MGDVRPCTLAARSSAFLSFFGSLTSTIRDFRLSAESITLARGESTGVWIELMKPSQYDTQTLVATISLRRLSSTSFESLSLIIEHVSSVDIDIRLLVSALGAEYLSNISSS